MLDKSVPHIDILMHRPAGTPFVEYPLPEGYRFVLFADGDEVDWAKIEASVLEFDDEIEALLYFQRDWLPYKRELMHRCVFVVAPSGEKVATTMAWWGYNGIKRVPWIHWVAVKPGYQGKGLGKAVVSHALRRLLDIEGDRDVYLKTQTWSHKAVEIYEKVGFAITAEPNLGGNANTESAQAMALIQELRQNRTNA